MGRIEKTVFVSYRRTDEPWGLAVFQDLTQHGYDVFIDYDGIASGKFATEIFENIRARAHFLVLLTPTALDRCSDPKDWMRREIEAALDSKRNIVPLMLAGFDFGTPATANQLTGKLAALKDYNGLEIPKARFFSSEMERLRNKYLNVQVDAVLHPASDSAQQVAKELKDKATMVLGEAQRQLLLSPEERLLQDEAEENRRAEEETRPKVTARKFWPVIATVAGGVVAVVTGLATLTDDIPKIWNGLKPIWVLVTSPAAPSAGPQSAPQVTAQQPAPPATNSATPHHVPPAAPAIPGDNGLGPGGLFDTQPLVRPRR